MREGFKLFLIAVLVGLAPLGCWRSAEIGTGAPDGGDTETDTLGGITDPDTGGQWFYEWGSPYVPTDDDLSGVYGFSSSDVFAVGENGTILHFDGAEWSEMAYPADAPGSDLGGVWGPAPWDVFAVGSDGTIIYYDGISWSSMISGTEANLHDVCGRSLDEVFAVGDDGTLLSVFGSEWSAIETGIEQHLFAAWCGPGAPVYTAGHANDAYGSSVLLRYNDGAVQAVEHPVGHFMYALGGVGPDTVFIGGGYQGEDENLHFEVYKSEGDGGFDPLSEGDALLLDLWAVGPGEVWAVGQTTSDPDSGRAAVFHVGGADAEPSVVFPDLPMLRGVWRDPDDAMGIVFAVGDDGAILHGVPTQAY